MVMTDGRAIYFADYPTFKMLAQGRLFDVLPYPVFTVVVALIAAYILKKTVIGRYVYAVGSNEVAAHLSGIKVQRVKIFVYAFCGLLTGIAGVILASRLNSGQPTVGVGYELEAIAAVVIGGTSLMGNWHHRRDYHRRIHYERVEKWSEPDGGFPVLANGGHGRGGHCCGLSRYITQKIR